MPITPDTKSWTWVLERACPDCGFDASATDPTSVSALIRDDAERWQTLLEHDEVRERPDDDTWSALEYGCHVRDVYRLFHERLGLMLDEDDPLFANWDQDETAVTARYREQDPRAVAEDLRAAATVIADHFDTVRGDTWHRTGRRSDGARFTVDTFSRYLVHDPIHHRWDVVRGLSRLS